MPRPDPIHLTRDIPEIDARVGDWLYCHPDHPDTPLIIVRGVPWPVAAPVLPGLLALADGGPALRVLP